MRDCGLVAFYVLFASSSLAYVLGCALGLGSRTAVLMGPLIPVFRDVETEKGQPSVLVEAISCQPYLVKEDC